MNIQQPEQRHSGSSAEQHLHAAAVQHVAFWVNFPETGPGLTEQQLLKSRPHKNLWDDLLEITFGAHPEQGYQPLQLAFRLDEHPVLL